MSTIKSGLIALFLSLIIMSFGNSLSGILLPIRAEQAHFSALDIGMMGALYSLGFVIGCVYAPGLIRRLGLVNSFALMSIISGVITIWHPIAIDPIMWIGFRFLCGFTSAGIFSVIESWLNGAADNRNRGMIFSFYMMINLACQTTGRFGIMFDNPDNQMLFVVTAAIMGAAFLPIMLVTPPTVQQHSNKSYNLRELWKLAPVGIMGNLGFGLCGGAFGALAPLYAQQNGLSLVGIALFCSAASIGGALSQYPLGRLSDRYDRRIIIALLCLAGIPVSLLLGLADDTITSGQAPLSHQWLLVALSMAQGALFYPLYSISVSHPNDHVPPHRYVEASSANLLIWGVGASIGPFIASAIMEKAGHAGLFFFMALVMTIVGGLCLRQFFHPTRHHQQNHSHRSNAALDGTTLPPESAPARPETLA